MDQKRIQKGNQKYFQKNENENSAQREIYSCKCLQ